MNEQVRAACGVPAVPGPIVLCVMKGCCRRNDLACRMNAQSAAGKQTNNRLCRPNIGNAGGGPAAAKSVAQKA